MKPSFLIPLALSLAASCASTPTGTVVPDSRESQREDQSAGGIATTEVELAERQVTLRFNVSEGGKTKTRPTIVVLDNGPASIETQSDDGDGFRLDFVAHIEGEVCHLAGTILTEGGTSSFAHTTKLGEESTLSLSGTKFEVKVIASIHSPDQAATAQGGA